MTTTKARPQPENKPISHNQVLILVSDQLLSRIVSTQRALNSYIARTPEEEPPPLLLQLPAVVQTDGCSAYLTISLILRPHTPPEVTGTEYQLERALHSVLTLASTHTRSHTLPEAYREIDGCQP